MSTFEEKILAAKSSEEIKELCIAAGEQYGTLVRQRDGNVTWSEIPPVRPPVPAQQNASPAADTCVRVVYPSGNNRFEIYGATEAELDEKERQIRKLF